MPIFGLSESFIIIHSRLYFFRMNSYDSTTLCWVKWMAEIITSSSCRPAGSCLDCSAAILSFRKILKSVGPTTRSATKRNSSENLFPGLSIRGTYKSVLIGSFWWRHTCSMVDTAKRRCNGCQMSCFRRSPSFSLWLRMRWSRAESMWKMCCKWEKLSKVWWVAKC